MIHDKYAKLQDAKAEFPEGFAASAISAIDTIMSTDKAFETIRQHRLVLVGDDRAERVVEAFAVALISSNPGLQAELALTEQRQKQRDEDVLND